MRLCAHSVVQTADREPIVAGVIAPVHTIVDVVQIPDPVSQIQLLGSRPKEGTAKIVEANV